MFQNLKRPCQLLVLILFCISISCQREANDQSSNINVNIQTIDTIEEFQIKETLGLPARIKYDESTDHILVFDLASQKVLEISKSGEIICEYGGEGRGPGELQGVEDFYVREDYLFIVDRSSFLINKYDRNGEFISALDYGELLLEKANNSFRPPSPALHDNYNEPYITIDGNVLLPAHTQGKSLYKLFDWKGNHLAEIGEIPENYAPQIDKGKIREALAARKVPSRDLHKTFFVTDRSAPDEIFLIYGTIPKIAKYSLSGEKIWERKIPETPEVDSLTVDLSQVIKQRSDYLPSVRKYVWGKTSKEGDLFLATYNNIFTPAPARPLWIHQFDPKGKLIQRYKIKSNTNLSYHLAIDFNSSQIFVPLLDGTGIRLYRF